MHESRVLSNPVTNFRNVSFSCLKRFEMRATCNGSALKEMAGIGITNHALL